VGDIASLNDWQPVFIQIMEIIEQDIVTSVYQPHDLIISTTQIAKLYSVNPTTAVKAISKLTDDGILYKRRGIGMCVAEGAKEKILHRRKKIFLGQTIDAFITEAQTLGISAEELAESLKAKWERKND